MTIPSTILGYPRIGRRRELKKGLESYWSGKIGEAELEGVAAEVRRATFDRLAELGLGASDYSIPDNSSLYDQVLDVTYLLGAVPERVRERTGLDQYFTLARGAEGVAPQEMTKWFDTNYHYLVPEIGPNTPISFARRDVIDRWREAREWGYVTRPVVVGPVTYLALAKGDDAGGEPLDRLPDVVSAYRELLAALAAEGIEWVEFDEPAIVSDNLATPREELISHVRAVYAEFASLPVGERRPNILLAVPYGDSSAAFAGLVETGVEALAIDVVRGSVPDAAGLAAAAYSGTRVLAGVIDGRNVWRSDLAAAARTLAAFADAGVDVGATTTTSLQHVPHDTADETWDDPELNANLHAWLAFANQKVSEVTTLATGLKSGWDAISGEVRAASAALEGRRQAAGVSVAAVRERVAKVEATHRRRPSYDERLAAQRERVELPLLPTTTIGSFPQTTELRTARAAHGVGRITSAEYETRIEEEISRVIDLQEELGLDVLVHGEPERNDMVQYFAELLDGFAVTTNGWVQSYGSRCTRPSILWGDVARSQDLTGRWWKYAQAQTSKPVKGMLTGPVTIIAWSFVRNDIPLGSVADQIALALRDEIDALQDDGCAIVQVDEAALRELLPLDSANHADYLEWSVGSFRLATGGARRDVQIHTHLCYSEFGQIIDAIDGLDADVTSIEAARSRMEVVDELAAHGFHRQVGPGVWDIHSPRIPSEEEITELLRKATSALDPKLVWANPDCGLKTRGYEETVASLRNLVAGAHNVRAELSVAADR